MSIMTCHENLSRTGRCLGRPWRSINQTTCPVKVHACDFSCLPIALGTTDGPAALTLLSPKPSNSLCPEKATAHLSSTCDVLIDDKRDSCIKCPYDCGSYCTSVKSLLFRLKIASFLRSGFRPLAVIQDVLIEYVR